ncbi:MAG TPA: hypothetical protein VIP05_03000 [Burkholderiaceae bacterium]
MIAAERRSGLRQDEVIARFAPELDNMRAAFGWCFGPVGSPSLGRRLAAGSLFIWFGLSLFSECQAWMKRARITIPLEEQGTEDAMAIHAAARSTEMFTRGASAASYAGWLSGVGYEVTPAGDLERAMQLVGPWTYNVRFPDYAQATELARRHESLVLPHEDESAIVTSCWMAGLTYQRKGEPRPAREHLEAFLARETPLLRRDWINLTGYDRHSSSKAILALALWTLGETQASSVACEIGVAQARDIGFDLPICEALLWSSFARYLGGAPHALVEAQASEMQERAERHTFNSHSALGLALRGLCAGARGEVDMAIDWLRDALAQLQRSHYGPFDPLIVGELADLLAQRGEHAAGLSEIREFERRHLNKVGWCMSELRRRHGLLLVRHGTEQQRSDGLALISQTRAHALDRGEAAWAQRCASSLADLN